MEEYYNEIRREVDKTIISWYNINFMSESLNYDLYNYLVYLRENSIDKDVIEYLDYKINLYNILKK